MFEEQSISPTSVPQGRAIVHRPMSPTSRYYPKFLDRLEQFRTVGVDTDSLFYCGKDLLTTGNKPTSNTQSRPTPSHNQLKQTQSPLTNPSSNRMDTENPENSFNEQRNKSAKKAKKEKKKPKKDDYPKVITVHTVHKSCKDFETNKIAQRIVQAQCDKTEARYEDFEALINEINLTHHISNAILFYRFLRPSPTDPQYKLKQIYRDYFKYFLDDRVPFLLATKKMKVEKPQVYLEYIRNYLCYLTDSAQVEYLQYRRNNSSC